MQLLARPCCTPLGEAESASHSRHQQPMVLRECHPLSPRGYAVLGNLRLLLGARQRCESPRAHQSTACVNAALLDP